jgi:Cupin-like domain
MLSSKLPRRLAEVAALSEQSPGPDEALIIPASELAQHEIPEFLARESRPVVLRRFLDGTRIAGLTFEHVRSLAGHHWLSASDKPRIASKVYGDGLDSRPMLLRDYLDGDVLAPGPGDPSLYEKYRNLRISKEFRQDLGLVRPRFLPREEMNPPCIWIGRGGSSTCLHTDPNDNFVVVCIGTKRFHLFPPRDLQWLYLGQIASSSLLTSPVDPRDPDLERYPDFAKTHRTVLDLEAGDLFFLPLGWAHFVESPTASFTYNYWLKPDATPFFKRTSPTHLSSARAGDD